jgi:hypothetical protein
MRSALSGLRRYIGTPRVSKHRIFVWVDSSVLLDSAAVAIALDDDFTLGVLQSRVHELWARAIGTQLRERESGFRYTSSTTFETFPFPSPAEHLRSEVAHTAARLVSLRDGWLNPPGLPSSDLEKRTLTGLYNERPTWLRTAHIALDGAVLASYGWSPESSDNEILMRLLELNRMRST